MLNEQQYNLQIACHTFPKSRTFVKLKYFFETSPCLIKPLSFLQKSVLLKARLGCLPLRLETGRYCRPPIPAQDRLCLVCPNLNREIECVYHVTFKCSVYNSERKILWNKLNLPDNMTQLDIDQQLCQFLCNPI